MGVRGYRKYTSTSSLPFTRWSDVSRKSSFLGSNLTSNLSLVFQPRFCPNTKTIIPKSPPIFWFKWSLCCYDLVNYSLIGLLGRGSCRFPNIDNKACLQAVQHALNKRKMLYPSTEFIVEAVKICLECNNPEFNCQHFAQIYGTAKKFVLMCRNPHGCS